MKVLHTSRISAGSLRAFVNAILAIVCILLVVTFAAATGSAM